MHVADLSIVRDERTVLNPHGVMHALSLYVGHFNLTRQQDASEAFLHLLISLRDEFAHCYVPHRSSLADITLSDSKVYKQREAVIGLREFPLLASFASP